MQQIGQPFVKLLGVHQSHIRGQMQVHLMLKSPELPQLMRNLGSQERLLLLGLLLPIFIIGQHTLCCNVDPLELSPLLLQVLALFLHKRDPPHEIV